MKITTDNIIELIEDYTGTTKVQLEMVTKKNGDDYQVWLRNEKGISIGLQKGLSFDNVKYISFYYTSKNNVVGLETIYLSEIVSYNLNRESFIKKWKLPQLERNLQKYVDNEEYDYAIKNRDFINHLKNKIK